jgi:hypothetical protein
LIVDPTVPVDPEEPVVLAEADAPADWGVEAGIPGIVWEAEVGIPGIVCVAEVGIPGIA